jgi:hypothetical protein
LGPVAEGVILIPDFTGLLLLPFGDPLVVRSIMALAAFLLLGKLYMSAIDPVSFSFGCLASACSFWRFDCAALLRVGVETWCSWCCCSSRRGVSSSVGGFRFEDIGG